MRKSTFGTATIVLALAALAVFAPGARAQGNPRVTLFGSASWVQAERNFVISGDTFRSNFAKGGKVGARGTLDLTDTWAIEATYAVGTNNLRIAELSGSTVRERAFGVRVHQLTGNSLFFFTVPVVPVRPFVVVGGGLMKYSPTDAAKLFAATREFVDEDALIRATNKPEVNFGFGVEARVINRLGVRVDVRDHITQVPRFGVPKTSSGPGSDFFPVSGITHNVEVSVGVVIYLTR